MRELKWWHKMPDDPDGDDEDPDGVPPEIQPDPR